MISLISNAIIIEAEIEQKNIKRKETPPPHLAIRHKY
jgi:hypothetical protein